MTNLVDLTGKHIVVTGASSGLGRATCVLLSQLGARVSLIARNEEKLNETISLLEGSGHIAYPYDLGEIDGIEALVKGIVAGSGKVDGLVHAAGVGTACPISMSKYDFLLDMMKLHFFSFVELVRHIGKKRNSNDGASIVAVSSVGTHLADKGKLAYSTSKGALDKAVRPMAIELGESRGIRVNTVNPAWIKTDIYYDFIENFGQERLDEILSGHIMGAAEPVDIANVIAFLLSDASKMITGQCIFADSGCSIH